MFALDDKKILILSIAAAVFALLFGVYHLLGQWQYYEKGQDILLGVYAVGCFILFFALRFTKIAQIIGAIALLGMILFYANLKFDWRKDYIESTVNGTPFILEIYMTEYPTMEENAFGSLLNKERWIPFADDCIKPAMRGLDVPKQCRSNMSIVDEYGINPTNLVNNHYKKMKRTAQRIQDGGLKTKLAYQQCLMNKSCAIIPLLPANVDPTQIEQQSDDYLQTRRMFWSLINDQNISPEICDYIDLCRVLRNVGVMPIEEPETPVKP